MAIQFTYFKERYPGTLTVFVSRAYGSPFHEMNSCKCRRKKKNLNLKNVETPFENHIIFLKNFNDYKQYIVF